MMAALSNNCKKCFETFHKVNPDTGNHQHILDD